MGANNSTGKNVPAPENVQIHHGVDVAARVHEHEVDLNRGFQRLNIDYGPQAVLSNVYVRASTTTSSFYRGIIPRSLTFLKMFRRNDKPLQHLCNYNSFVVHEPRPGFPVNGYAFLSTPIPPADSNFSFVIQLAGEELSHFTKSRLAIGFTSCDPKSISWAELPYKSIEDLDKRKEYWIWSDQFETQLLNLVREEFCFTVKSTGDVFVSKNAGRHTFLFHVDRSIRIWPFFVLSENLVEIRVLGKILFSPAEIEQMKALDFVSAPAKNPVAPPDISFPSPRSSATTTRQTLNFSHHDNEARARSDASHENQIRFHGNGNNNSDKRQPRENPGGEKEKSETYEKKKEDLINSNSEVLSNVHVRACTTAPSFYRGVIPLSLTFLKMSKINDKQDLPNYNSFVVQEPRPGFPVNGYAFLSTPIFPGGHNFSFVIKTANKDSLFLQRGSRLVIGFTSCDPKSISWAELPYKNFEDLHNRKEYWIGYQFATEMDLQRDEFCFTVKSTGDVFVSKNAERHTFVFHVDRSIRIWPFFALFGNLVEIRVLGKISLPQTEIETMTANFPSAPPKNLVSPLQISSPSPRLPSASTSQQTQNFNPHDNERRREDRTLFHGNETNNINPRQPRENPGPGQLLRASRTPAEASKKVKSETDQKKKENSSNSNSEILYNVRVRDWSTTSSFYSHVIPDSLGFLRMSKVNVKQDLESYNSFVVLEPLPGFHVNGYAFLSTPISPADSQFSFVIQLAREELSDFPKSRLATGFTSCDPKSISWAELPYKNIEDLDNRNEYWIWSDSFVTEMKIYDEFCFTVKSTGDVFVSKNGGGNTFIFHVDRSIPIWPFFALFGKFTEIRVLGKILIPQAEIESMTSQFPSAPPSNVVSPPQISLPSPPQSRLENTQNPDLARINSSAPVNLDTLLPSPPRSSPPTKRQTQNSNSHDNGGGRGRRGRRGQSRVFIGNRGQRDANNGNENNNSTNEERQPRENRGRGQTRGQNRGQRSQDDQYDNRGRGGRFRGRGPTQSIQAPRLDQDQQKSKNQKSETEHKKKEDSSNSLCIICCESEKNCIFVPCNHNCMCFECGNEYFQRKKLESRGGQNPECPICRTKSTNVVRIYTA